VVVVMVLCMNQIPYIIIFHHVKLFPQRFKDGYVRRNDKKLTWKHPAEELRADLSFWSSFSTCLGSCDEEGRNKLMLIIGIEPNGGEDSM